MNTAGSRARVARWGLLRCALIGGTHNSLHCVAGLLCGDWLFETGQLVEPGARYGGASTCMPNGSPCLIVRTSMRAS